MDPHPSEIARDLPALSIDVFPDDRRLLVSTSQSSHLWIVPLDGSPVTRAREKGTDGEQLLALSPDGERVAMWRDHEVRVGAVEGGPSLPVPALPARQLVDFAWAPDGRRFAAILQPEGASVVTKWLVIGRVDDAAIASVRESADLVSGVAWLAPDRLAYLEAEDRTHASLREVTLDGAGHPLGPPRRLGTAPTPDVTNATYRAGRFLFAASVTRTEIGTFGWTRSRGLDPFVHRPTPPEVSENPVSWTYDGRVLVTTGEDEQVHVEARPLDGGAAEVVIAGNGKVIAAEALPAGDALAYRSSEDGHVTLVRIRHRASGVPEEQVLFELAGIVMAKRWVEACVRCVAHHDVCVASEREGDRTAFFRFDPDTGQRREPFLRTSTQFFLDRCTLTSDGRSLVFADEASIHVVDVASGEQQGAGFPETVTGLHFEKVIPVPGGGFLASGSDATTGAWGLWRLEARGATTLVYSNVDKVVTSPQLSPDGKAVLTRLNEQKWTIRSLEP